jgi:hypothetical protein
VGIEGPPARNDSYLQKQLNLLIIRMILNGQDHNPVEL